MSWWCSISKTQSGHEFGSVRVLRLLRCMSSGDLFVVHSRLSIALCLYLPISFEGHDLCILVRVACALSVMVFCMQTAPVVSIVAMFDAFLGIPAKAFRALSCVSLINFQ